MEQNTSTAGAIIGSLILLSPVCLAIFFWIRARTFKKRFNNLSDRNSKCQSEVESLRQKLSPIFDAEVEAEQLRNEATKLTETARVALAEADEKARKAIQKSKDDAYTIVNSAQEEAASLILDAKEEAQLLRRNGKETQEKALEKSEQLKSEALVESDRIIEYANKRAQDIAGEALEAKSKADHYQDAIIAMQNAIDGYKDDYIIPNHTLLDELAEEFSHKEAGEQLKTQRKRIKELISIGRAADCDYAEPNRRKYAIHFVIDAFNGKVDSALSKVKHDNLGKIKQEIIDAFALVNHNGKPFRNARISREFLDARLDELKWAVATHELKQQALAEQRAIREQIREEDKARREMEKAIKEAEKEERLLQKALEKARKELSDASDDQKKQYEAQLAELESKLSEAELKGQRAVSMAQQTKQGHVYIISNIGSFGEHIYKVGMTRRLEPLDRVKELGDASVPFGFDVHAMIFSKDAPSLEKALHKAFYTQSVNKVNPRKEFFKLPLSDIKSAIEAEDITDIHWTMKADAEEYRESLAIEKEMALLNNEKATA
ncbi:DUF4041 domain-containing protein [Marinomonas mediterranea]|jgi:T5orf172 domain.|uniref:Helicase A859L n=1 Tax=Marinomonas mediterranea (strain ATCC 700492 / JCM 21426 / NBRC 103028 / MMB-1) TaxID=717774 RepID=F2JZ59_MARM1|nr:DUF4041 domain-containing protein [Marinomonas mediterranea]ADZ92037.1 helicase A859L [Marinomonas mediterranea MMB-1]WCN10004.1 DUF4041 domain-containing protein [Marinomonas mediterranea]WCN18110.1 DUF4041 domain-containing protein [Marinomonas mediterranea MMB-1]